MRATRRQQAVHLHRYGVAMVATHGLLVELADRALQLRGELDVLDDSQLTDAATSLAAALEATITRYADRFGAAA